MGGVEVASDGVEEAQSKWTGSFDDASALDWTARVLGASGVLEFQ